MGVDRCRLLFRKQTKNRLPCHRVIRIKFKVLGNIYTNHCVADYLNPGMSKLFTVKKKKNKVGGRGNHLDPRFSMQVVAHKSSSFGIQAALG